MVQVAEHLRFGSADTPAEVEQVADSFRSAEVAISAAEIEVAIADLDFAEVEQGQVGSDLETSNRASAFPSLGSR